jgi:hypothetical protein
MIPMRKTSMVIESITGDTNERGQYCKTLDTITSAVLNLWNHGTVSAV